MKNVLIVDDEMLIGMNTKMILEQHNYEAITANSGEKAISLVEEGNIPDLILMDIDMGKGRMDGVEATRIINENHDIPVVFHSGHTDRETIEKTKSVTKYGYVHKTSMNEMYLLSSIYTALNLHEANRKLKESEKRYRNLYESITDHAFVLDREWRYVMVNEAARKVIGLPEEKIIGTNILDLFKGFETTEFFKVYKRVMEKRQPETVTGAFVHDDGRKGWYEVKVDPTPQGILCIARDITERKQAELELQEGEKKHRKLFNTMLNGFAYCKMLFDKDNQPFDWIYIDINVAFTKITGLKREDIVGKRVTEAIPGIKEDTPELFEIYGKVAQTEEETFFESYLDTLKIWFSVSVYCPEKGYFITVFDDITERKQAEKVLRENEEKFRILFETMSQGVVYQDGNGNIISINPAAEHILGVTCDQMKGRTSVDPRWHAIHEDGSNFSGETHPAMVSLKTGQPVQNAIMGVFHPDIGKHRWISIDSAPLFKSGEKKPYQVYTTFKDITERKQAENQIRQSLKEKEILLKEIHHRVKNNLAMISALINLQSGDVPNVKMKNRFEDLRGQINSIGLIHEKLYKSQDLSTISFKDYVRDIIDSIFSAFSTENIQVNIEMKKNVLDIL